MTNAPCRRVAVVGTGISGVTAAAHLIIEGLDVTVFERSPVAGGVWVLNPTLPLEPTYPSAKSSVAETTFYNIPESTDPHVLFSSPGAAYEGLKNNVPTELMEVSLNKWKPNTASFSPHNVLAEYIQDTAAKTGVTERTQFNTKVILIQKHYGVWKVKTSIWDPATKTTRDKDWEFDAVVVATGHYHVPKVPDIPGLAAWKAAFPSRVQHSKRFRNNTGFENQTVLLIGGSASSTDIALELSPVAKKIWQSTRDGQFDHPPSMLPENAERVGPVRSFDAILDGPSTADSGTTGPIPTTITLADGRVLRNIDRVIIATGYQFTLPFFPDLHCDDVAPEDADGHVLVTDGQQLHNLHEDIFYIPDPTLSFVGVPFYTATFSLFEFQAIAVAAFLSGKSKLPPEEEIRETYKKRVQHKGYGKKFHSLWGEDTAYAKRLMDWVNDGRKPAERKPDGYSAEWIAKKEHMVKLRNSKNSLFEENQPRRT